jgi:hypothetical protein
MAQSDRWLDSAERSMAAFLIFCRNTEVSPHHFEARVFVVPAGERESGLATRSECRIFESAELAASECARMAEAMKSRLALWGHEVVLVDSMRQQADAVACTASPSQGPSAMDEDRPSRRQEATRPFQD